MRNSLKLKTAALAFGFCLQAASAQAFSISFNQNLLGSGFSQITIGNGGVNDLNYLDLSSNIENQLDPSDLDNIIGFQFSLSGSQLGSGYLTSDLLTISGELTRSEGILDSTGGSVGAAVLKLSNFTITLNGGTNFVSTINTLLAQNFLTFEDSFSLDYTEIYNASAKLDGSFSTNSISLAGSSLSVNSEISDLGGGGNDTISLLTGTQVGLTSNRTVNFDVSDESQNTISGTGSIEIQGSVGGVSLQSGQTVRLPNSYCAGVVVGGNVSELNTCKKVPEPSSVFSLLAGAFAAGLLLKRKGKAH